MNAPRSAHRLLVHPDVDAELVRLGQPVVQRRFHHVTRRLMVEGATTKVKGTKGRNAGWRRVGLGGTQGKQFYLWWRPVEQGADGVPQLQLRTVRHHDDHTQVTNDRAIVHRVVEPATTDALDAPWTSEQEACLTSKARVRFVQGLPGSGKTTVLQGAIERSGASRALYLTWSRPLAESVSRWFGGADRPAFARPDLTVVAWDFPTFLGAVLGRDVVRADPAVGRQRLRERLVDAKLPPTKLGVWRDREDDLFDEIRAHLLARFATWEDGKLRFKKKEYRLEREAQGLAGDAITVIDFLIGKLKLGDAAHAGALFPEIVAALEARSRLVREELPGDLQGYGEILVDEVQDLSVAELAVVGELARRTGGSPRLTLAGDEGQTVRPTAFSWPAAEGALGLKSKPERFDLHGSLRCADAIVAVLDRGQELYKYVPKDLRPRGAQWSDEAELGQGRAVLAVATDAAEGNELLRHWLDDDAGAVVCVGEQPPAWVDGDLRDDILTPSRAKGLEYTRVLVIGTAAALHAVVHAEDEDALDALGRRAAIDRLRVAMSRGSRTLAVLSVQSPEHEAALTLLSDLMGPDRVDPWDLPELGAASDEAPGDRVPELLATVDAVVDELPRRAWRLLATAERLAENVPELVVDVASKRAEVGFRLLVRAEGVAGVDRVDLRASTVRAILDLGLDRLGEVVESVPADLAASDGRVASWLLALVAVPVTQRPAWLPGTLRARRQALLAAVRRADLAWHDLSKAPKGALAEVVAWLDGTEVVGAEVLEEVTRRASLAAEGEGSPGLALVLHERTPDPDVGRAARLAEADGRPEEAVQRLVEGGRDADALLVARRHALVEEASGIASRLGDDATVERLKTLLSLEIALRGVLRDGSLTPAEEVRLAAAVRVEDALVAAAREAERRRLREEEERLRAMEERTAGEAAEAKARAVVVEERERGLVSARARLDADARALDERKSRLDADEASSLALLEEVDRDRKALLAEKVALARRQEEAAAKEASLRDREARVGRAEEAEARAVEAMARAFEAGAEASRLAAERDEATRRAEALEVALRNADAAVEALRARPVVDHAELVKERGAREKVEAELRSLKTDHAFLQRKVGELRKQVDARGAEVSGSRTAPGSVTPALVAVSKAPAAAATRTVAPAASVVPENVLETTGGGPVPPPSTTKTKYSLDIYGAQRGMKWPAVEALAIKVFGVAPDRKAPITAAHFAQLDAAAGVKVAAVVKPMHLWALSSKAGKPRSEVEALARRVLGREPDWEEVLPPEEVARMKVALGLKA